MPSVPVSVLEVVLLPLARLFLMTDKGLFSSKIDLDPGSRSTMTPTMIESLPTGPCRPTDLNLRSATDPSPT
jgi:hypothetical protein